MATALPLPRLTLPKPAQAFNILNWRLLCAASAAFLLFSFLLFLCVPEYSTLFLYLSPCDVDADAVADVGAGVDDDGGVDADARSAVRRRFFSLFWFLI